MIFFSMSKGTKSFGHDKALACESRGFVYNKKGCIVLTHPLFLFFQKTIIGLLFSFRETEIPVGLV